MEIRGYDAWKTAAPEPIESSLFVDVDQGSLVLFAEEPEAYEDRIAGRVEIGDCGCDGETPEADNARIVEELRKILRHEEPATVTEFICSSSVDFPEEYGVRRPVDIRALLAQALEREA